MPIIGTPRGILGRPKGSTGLGSRHIPLPPFTVLPALAAAGGVISAWVLDAAIAGATPASVTLSGSNVSGWAAAYGTIPVNFINGTVPPVWDASQFGNYGGLVFNGAATNQMTGTPITGFPDGSTDCWLLAAGWNNASGVATLFGYGGGIGASIRKRLLTLSTSDVLTVQEGANSSVVTSATPKTGAFTFGAQIRAAGNTTIYSNGVAVFTAASPVHTVTMSATFLGLTWSGVIANAAILSGSVVEADFLSLEAEFRSRIAN